MKQSQALACIFVVFRCPYKWSSFLLGGGEVLLQAKIIDKFYY